MAQTPKKNAQAGPGPKSAGKKPSALKKVAQSTLGGKGVPKKAPRKSLRESGELIRFVCSWVCEEEGDIKGARSRRNLGLLA